MTYTLLAPCGSALPGFPWGHYPSGGIHRALDFPVDTGTPVRCANTAVVIRAGWDDGGFGWHVRVRLSNDHFVIYGHLSKLAVKAGQNVSRGQVIGYSGSTGRSTGPHLHMEVRRLLYDPRTAYDFTKMLVYPIKFVPPAREDFSRIVTVDDEALRVGKWSSSAGTFNRRLWSWLWHEGGPGGQKYVRDNAAAWDAEPASLFGWESVKAMRRLYKTLDYRHGGYSNSASSATYPGTACLRALGLRKD